MKAPIPPPQPAQKTMRAWRLSKFEEEPLKAIRSNLRREESVPVIKPDKGEVRIRVKHASVNPIDWRLFSGGSPLFAATLPYVPGFDISGEIDVVGEGVHTFAKNDKVVAYIGLKETCAPGVVPRNGSCGAFAEYVVIPSERIARIPSVHSTNTYDPRELAGLPLAGLTAYQALFTGEGGRSLEGNRPLGNLQSGQKLLVLGGSSSTGMFAIQLGRAAGAHVAATASKSPMPDGTLKTDFVGQALGADRVIDYRTEDWSEELEGQSYDMIFDCVGDNADLAKALKVLKPEGTFVSIANFAPVVPASATFRYEGLLVTANGRDLEKLIELVGQGKLKVYVDGVYSFEKVKDAMERSISSRASGKIIIDISSD